MTTITVERAQQELPSLIERTLAGEDIVIRTTGAAVRLALLEVLPVPPEALPSRENYRGRGILKGQLVVSPGFFEPLSDEECGVADATGSGSGDL